MGQGPFEGIDRAKGRRVEERVITCTLSRVCIVLDHLRVMRIPDGKFHIRPSEMSGGIKLSVMPLFHQRIKPQSCLGPLIVGSRWKKSKNGREYWVSFTVWD